MDRAQASSSDVQRPLGHRWDRDRRPTLIAGTSAVLIALAGSRWGTYVGLPPLFICDVLLMVGTFHFLTTVMARPTRPERRGRVVPVVFVALLLYVLLVAVFSLGRDPVLTWARDAVPYLYAFLTPLAIASLRRAQDGSRDRTYSYLKAALGVHAVWCVAVVVTNTFITGFPAPTPFTQPVFQVRPDFDGAILAVTSGLLLRSYLMDRAKVILLVLAGVCAWTALQFESRAVVLSFGLVAAYALFAAMRSGSGRVHGKTVVAFLAIGAAAVFFLPTTTPGQRLLTSVGVELTAPESGKTNDGTGTQRARSQTWKGVNEWSRQTTQRRWLGSGFGNDFVHDAGVDRFLEGTTYENVRSPHNWFVANLARLGLVGLLMSLLLVLHALWLILRSAGRLVYDRLSFVAALVVVAVLPVSSVGVVLEAPFGAIPFWWSLGILYLACQPAKTLRSAPDDESRHATNASEVRSRP